MRHLVLILLAATLAVNVACSKKKSSSTVATAPPAVVDPNQPYNPGGYLPGWPAPTNASFYYGTVQVQKYDVYQYFLESAFGYQAYTQGGSYGQQQGFNYSYNYSCDLNIFRWIFGGNIASCGGYQNQYDQFIYDLSYQRAMVQLLFQADGTVKGLWLAGASQDGAGNMYAYKQISFRGRLRQLQDGRFIIEAGPLVFLSTTQATNFDVFFQEWKIGNVTVR